MNTVNLSINTHELYHAHVYFKLNNGDVAKNLCKDAGEIFNLSVGRFHKKPVGPHPQWSCQISFSKHEFDAFIPWLEFNRQGLSILIHAVTGDNLRDHTEYAYWLGDKIDLNLDFFRNN